MNKHLAGQSHFRVNADSIALRAVVLALLTQLLALSGTAQPVITVNRQITHQTMNGWEVVAWADQESATFPQYREELLRRAVNEAGINRVRLEVRSGAENSTDYWTQYRQGQVTYDVWRANRYATVNDNADPSVINPAGFNFSELDNTVEKLVLPLRGLVAANGENLYVNVNYVAFTAQITQGGSYHHAVAAEYAEFMLALFQHMDGKYGFVPDAVEIILEPDNVSQWSGTTVGRAIVATEARLKAAGYDCEFIAPSCTSMANAISYFDALVQVSGALAALDELSYHRYAGVTDANLRAIASRGSQYGLRTSMLEWWSNGNGQNVLHTDLKVGNNSAWEHGVIGGPGVLDDSMTLYVVDNANPSRPVVRLNRKGQLTRQYYRFVRSGAVRLEAQTTSGVFDPLAFVNPSGESVVVVKVGTGGSFKIRGLPKGTYGLNYSTPSSFNVSLPQTTIAEGGEISATMPRDGVLTIFSKAVRVFDARSGNGSISFKTWSITPNARITVEKSPTPADPGSWSVAGIVSGDALVKEWSEAVGEGATAAFYRVKLD